MSRSVISDSMSNLRIGLLLAVQGEVLSMLDARNEIGALRPLTDRCLVARSAREPQGEFCFTNKDRAVC